MAGQPTGRASVAEVRSAVEILMNSGRDWTDRMKRLAEHAPDLNIFSAKFVFRDALGWEITQEGRQFLSALEKAAADQRERPRPQPTIDPPSNERHAHALDIAEPHGASFDRRRWPRRRRRKARSDRRTA
nr:hypothetical protein [Bradyrhizobium acaciae]